MMADTPTRDNRIPLQITVDGRDVSVSVDGGVSLSNFLGEWRSWGVMDVTPYGGSPVRVSKGSGSEAELMTSSLPEEPLASSLSYLACRCPVSGVVSMNLEMQVAEIKFDLDNLIEEEDEVDDPDVTIDVSLVVEGPGEVRPTECGVHEGVWSPAEEPVVTVDSDDLSVAIQSLCDAALIIEPGRCTALLQAAANVGSVDVNVGENKLQNAVGSAVAIELDNSFCHLN